MAEAENKLKIYENNRVSIKDWCEFNGVDYNDTMRYLKANKTRVKTYGKVKLLEKKELDDLFTITVDSRFKKAEAKAEALKIKSQQKSKYANIVETVVKLGYNADKIESVLTEIVSREDVRKYLLERKIPIPDRLGS